MAANNHGAGDSAIVVGVDFGTTFTGVAFANSRLPTRINVIRAWPNHAGNLTASGKVPTKLCYLPDGTFKWGALVDPNAAHDDVLEYFKLALDPEHVERLQSSTLTKRNLLGQDIDGIVTDYLTGLGNFITEKIQQDYGDVVMRTHRIQYVLTVPAIWSDRAKQRTTRAFEAALDVRVRGSVILISEPEAAATCVLQQIPRHDLRVDDCFVVVDAGGGTVDLISYRVRELHPTLGVSEAAEGSGGACGSAFLNERFEQLMVRTLDQEEGFGLELVRDALFKWDSTVKRRFSTADLAAGGQTYTFQVAGLADNRDLKIRRGRWTVTAAEVLRIFDGVVLEILKLVTEQRAATQVDVKSVLLVGGFGQSTYLRERLEAHLGRGIQVLQPENAWTAVVEGAVMKGLSQIAPLRANVLHVVDRKARKHYGYELSVAYVHALHWSIERNKRWDGYNGRDEVDVMQWFIRKGDPVTESQPFLKDFIIASPVNWGAPKVVTLHIMSDSVSINAPLTNNENVHELVFVEANLEPIQDQIPQHQGNDGLLYYVASCQIEIRYDSASTSYTLLYNGQRYQTVTAELV